MIERVNPQTFTARWGGEWQDRTRDTTRWVMRGPIGTYTSLELLVWDSQNGIPLAQLGLCDESDMGYYVIVYGQNHEDEDTFFRRCRDEMTRFVRHLESMLPKKDPGKLPLNVGDLQMTVRPRSMLIRAGILTTAQLLTLTGPNLLAVRGFGRMCLREVKRELARYGVSLPEEGA